MKFTRGFRGSGQRDPRLPPGQYDTGRNWPVLTAEATPRLHTDNWTFTVEGLVANPTTWTWEQIHALPESTYNGDIHCVTTWSKLGMTFTGVSVDTLLEVAQPLPSASYVLAWSPHRIHHQSPPGRLHRRPSLGGLGSRAAKPSPASMAGQPVS